ncbi:phage tail tape measure protein [Aestuariibius sp. 2305UL40-4]|uniref:phage tail tape measure protein n=1 Tax=Aestuariibius violaceus TaxID=3234132 RepID=UPI00345EA679
MAEFDDLGGELNALESDLGEASRMTAAFGAELASLRSGMDSTVRDLGNLESGISRGLRRAFDGLAFDGMKLADALDVLGRSIIDTAYNAAMRPVTDHFGGLISDGINSIVSDLMPFEKGGTFSQGRVMPFAKGGVVSGPVTFPMRGGMGLMGEAGPEAIIPLTRGADGRLGVRAQGGGTTHVTMNINTPDVAGFQRSHGQIAVQMNRMLGHGRRNA